MNTFAMIFCYLLILLISTNGIQIECGKGHVLSLNSTSLCLSDEDTLFVDGYWINCNPQQDDYSNYAMAAIQAFCENDLTVEAGIPKTTISCNGHKIVFQKTGHPCLNTEYGVFVDDVQFLCVTADDTYLFDLTNVINAICAGEYILIKD